MINLWTVLFLMPLIITVLFTGTVFPFCLGKWFGASFTRTDSGAARQPYSRKTTVPWCTTAPQSGSWATCSRISSTSRFFPGGSTSFVILCWRVRGNAISWINWPSGLLSTWKNTNKEKFLQWNQCLQNYCGVRVYEYPDTSIQ